MKKGRDGLVTALISMRPARLDARPAAPSQAAHQQGDDE